MKGKGQPKGKRGCRREAQPLAEGADDEATVSTGALTSEGSQGEDTRLIGRWVTDRDEIAVLFPRAPDLPQDVTFILEGECGGLLPTVVKADHQKADDAGTPTHLWSHFFRRSFLARIQKGAGMELRWEVGGPDVYRRHPLRRRDSMPEGWEPALDGFRRLGLRWWRRNLLRTFRPP